MWPVQKLILPENLRQIVNQYMGISPEILAQGINAKQTWDIATNMMGYPPDPRGDRGSAVWEQNKLQYLKYYIAAGKQTVDIGSAGFKVAEVVSVDRKIQTFTSSGKPFDCVAVTLTDGIKTTKVYISLASETKVNVPDPDGKADFAVISHSIDPEFLFNLPKGSLIGVEAPNLFDAYPQYVAKSLSLFIIP